MPLEALVRPAVPGNADALAVLGTQVWMHTYATDGVSRVIAEYVVRELSSSAMSATLADPGKHVAVAEIRGNLIAFAVLAYPNPCPHEPGTQAELATLYVQEHFLRQGVGTALLKYAERLAQSRCSGMWLTVNAGNVPAIAFYGAHGYAKAGTAFFELGGRKYENHVLTKRGA
jgi:diamine N-acetyltransferase